MRTLYTKKVILKAIDNMSLEDWLEYEVKNDCIFLVLLNGGAWYAGQLLARLNVPSRVEYIKVSSYKDKDRGNLVFDFVPPTHIFKDKRVVLIDDICDSGVTLFEVEKKLLSLKDAPASVVSTVLVRRDTAPHKDNCHACIETDSKDFFVGCGMDDNGKGRFINYISKVC